MTTSAVDAWLRCDGPPRVEYGSPEFDALPAGDPRRRAAVLHAADCWARLRSSPHVAELLGEWVDWENRRAARQASHEISVIGARTQVGDPNGPRTWAHPTYGEIERRRAEPGRAAREFAKRHGGPYVGGPVDWSSGRPARREAA